jgi:hypothetical protein
MGQRFVSIGALLDRAGLVHANGQQSVLLGAWRLTEQRVGAADE